MQPPHAVAPAPASPLSLRMSPTSAPVAAAAAAASREGLRVRVLVLLPPTGSRTAPRCALPGSAWGLGGERGGSPGSGAGRARRLHTPACLLSLTWQVGVQAAWLAAARGQSLVAGLGLNFRLGKFPC